MSMICGSPTGNPQAALPSNRMRSRRKCRFFIQGHCKFGDLCKRSHGDPPGEVPTSPTVRMPVPAMIVREEQEKVSRINEASLGREAANTEVAQKVQQTQEEGAADRVRQVHIALLSLQAKKQEELVEWRAAEVVLKAQQAQEKATRQDEARRVREARQEEERRVWQAEREREAAEVALKAQQARRAAYWRAEAHRQRARQAEQEAQLVELTKEEAAMTMQHIVLGFIVVTFSAGLVIQDVLLGFESCRITIKNLPIDATVKEVCELFTQQGIESGRFHVLELARTLARKQEAFLIGHEDLKIVAIGLEEIDFRQERLSFEIMNHSGGDGMIASALGANTLTLTRRAPLNRLIEAYFDASNIVPRTGDTWEAICPICYDAVTSPIKLGCGHAHCSACIRHFLTSASTFPLVCMGDEDTCHVPIPIPVIQRFLPIQQFANLLETAFITHIDRHPQDFKYCTTPDCRQVYRCTTADAASIICPSCLSCVCSACHEEGHEGMTCAERKLNKDPEEQERLNDELATQSGFKKCPQCTVWIEKTEGCNHMECKCGAHICWVCMGIFDAVSVYQHMHTAHGGIDDVNENGAEPLFQRENFAEQQEALRQVALRRAQLAQQQLRREAEDEQHRIARARQLLRERAREQARAREEARRQEALEARARITEFHRHDRQDRLARELLHERVRAEDRMRDEARRQLEGRARIADFHRHQDRLTQARELLNQRVREQTRVQDEARKQKYLEVRARAVEFHRHDKQDRLARELLHERVRAEDRMRDEERKRLEGRARIADFHRHAEQDRLARELLHERVREQTRVRDEAHRQKNLEARARTVEFHRRDKQDRLARELLHERVRAEDRMRNEQRRRLEGRARIAAFHRHQDHLIRTRALA